MKGDPQPEFVARIEAAVAATEARTSAEIVVVVARRAGRYADLEAAAGAALAFLVLALMAYADFLPAFASADLLPLTLAGFVAGFLAARHCAPLARRLAGARRLAAAVEERAAAEFRRQNVHLTAGRTGLLVLVALFERRVVLLADSGVERGAGAAAVGRCAFRLNAVWRAADWRSALAEALAALGDELAAGLPLAPGDVNEIPNRPVFAP